MPDKVITLPDKVITLPDDVTSLPDDLEALQNGITGLPGEPVFFADEELACHYVKKQEPDAIEKAPYHITDDPGAVRGYPEEVTG